jgi:2-C-methyl-D-erythritol 2,4-cyclodiphosphate synthase
MGDIGTHFPDTDSRFKDADSMRLLAEVLGQVRGAFWSVTHVDTTVLLERPKLLPHREAIVESLTEALGCSVNLKATTGEGMGFVGRGEGAAAMAVVTLNRRW